MVAVADLGGHNGEYFEDVATHYVSSPIKDIDAVGQFICLPDSPYPIADIKIPDHADFRFTTGMTIGAWIKTLAPYSGTIANKTGGYTDSYWLGMGSDGSLELFVNTNDGWKDLSGVGSIGDDAWHFVGARFQSGRMSIWIDDAESGHLDVASTTLTTGTSDLLIGSDEWGNNTQGLIASVDALGLAPVHFTDAQMLSLYNAGKP